MKRPDDPDVRVTDVLFFFVNRDDIDEVFHGRFNLLVILRENTDQGVVGNPASFFVDGVLLVNPDIIEELERGTVNMRKYFFQVFLDI